MSMDDKTFLEQLNIAAEDFRLALAIRRVIAHYRGLPVEEILPDMSPRELAYRMRYAGWDAAGFMILLEEEHGEFKRNINNYEEVGLPEFAGWSFLFWKRPGANTLGEWIEKAIPRLRECYVR